MRMKGGFLGLCLLFVSFALAGPSLQQQTTIPSNIQAVIKQNCSVSGCHTGKHPAANLIFDPDKFLASVLNVQSREIPDKKIVDTAAPELSYLLAKIKGEAGIVGKRMPLNRPPLEQEKIAEVEAWVMSLKSPSSESSGNPPEILARKGPFIESVASTSETPKAQAKGFAKPAFWGTRLVNLPTTTTPGKGEFLFRISHRLQLPASSGWDSFYGFDGPAYILFSFGYGITDNLSLTLGRAKLYQEWELYADWLLLEQGKKTSWPLSAALHIGGGIVTQDEPVGANWSGRARFSALLSLSTQLSERFSLLVVPAYTSNANYWEESSEGILSLGLGGRFMVLNDISLVAEWIPVLAGYKDDYSGWGLGIEKKIGGHVFQFFITNTIGMTAAQYLPGGDLSLGDGDFRFGFNIFRTF